MEKKYGKFIMDFFTWTLIFILAWYMKYHVNDYLASLTETKCFNMVYGGFFNNSIGGIIPSDSVNKVNLTNVNISDINLTGVIK